MTQFKTTKKKLGWGTRMIKCTESHNWFEYFGKMDGHSLHLGR